MERVLKMAKLAIPYRRYSSDSQTGNSSLERQQQMINQWLESEDGKEFTTSPAFTYTDEAVSGFSGSHISKGDFGRFLSDLDAGKFQRFEQPTLLIENVDRFGRQKATKAIGLLTEILEKGVNVYFLSTHQLLTGEMDDMQLMMFVMESSRAHGESSRKSQMVNTAWDKKQDKAGDGAQLTKNVPWWIDPNDKNKVIPERAALVKEVFSMRLHGKSCNKIAAHFNEQGVAVPSNRKVKEGKEYKKARVRVNWDGVFVSTLLSNRAVMGYLAEQSMTPSNSVVVVEVDPLTGKEIKTRKLKPKRQLRKEIPGYFPQVINPAMFASIQMLKDEQAGRKSVTTQVNSIKLFKKSIVCSECGGLVNVYGSREKYAGIYQCSNTRVKACQEISINRAEVDNALLKNLIPNLSKLNVNDSLEVQIAELENERDQLVQRAKNIYDIAEISGLTDELKSRLKANTKRQSELNTQIDALKTKRDATEFESVDHLDLSTFEGRFQAQIIIKRMIKRITLNTNTRTMDVLLVNGSEMKGFEIDSKANLREVTQVMSGQKELPEPTDERMALIQKPTKEIDLGDIYSVTDSYIKGK
ncbi:MULTISPECIES: recombinase family protein [unclassified Leclercia]|uniref:Recombinase family protein n=1 Tax=Leclercia barmai TaxID=2785629 RepID=A0ABS7RVR5_9ENTR|nr:MULTISPECIES: recombinase family protein [unclassified Leclercia]MBZ0057471.1 recombinase family protein [Leclercia sp. EMC7]MCM5695635.1 recombinase family protein [Leclercia sp. LTM01]MCM5700043.1 recombinase family protein [Leclercia sp. LTM14]